MTASEQIRQHVAKARENAKRAEKEYDAAAFQIQLKSSHSIDLFGGSATRQVADIAAMARKACESLYASYQMIVRVLDGSCRPLLDQDPSAESVKEVADLISWLNAESEIENNFTASLNASSLGDVANVRFIPTIENKMIEQFWTQKYREMPDYIEAENRRKARIEAEKQERQKRQLEEKAAAKKYEAEKKQREMRYKSVLSACERREAEFRKNLDLYIDRCVEEKKAVLQKENEKKVAELQKKKAAANYSLARLGMFQMAEKKQLTAKINKIMDEIDAIQRYDYTEDAAKDLKDKAKKATEQYKKQMKEYMEKRFPFDQKLYEERCRTGITGEKREILNVLEEIGSGTIGDIMEAGGLNMSSMKCSALLRQLVLEGIVRREEIRRIAYFEIDQGYAANGAKKSITSSNIDGRYEDTTVTDDDMPEMPDAETVMTS